MIWEFYELEKHNGTSAKAYDIQVNGHSRRFIFCNDPKHQRVCNCQGCGTKIPREVPRVKLRGSYYYGAGLYCMSCGINKLKEKQLRLEGIAGDLVNEADKLRELQRISKMVMKNEFYMKKMALGKMFQVMEENQNGK